MWGLAERGSQAGKRQIPPCCQSWGVAATLLHQPLPHLLPCSELLRAPDKHPLRLTRGPLRVRGAAGSRAARATCPSGAPTPNPAPGGSHLCWVHPASAAWPAEPPHATETPMQDSPQPELVGVNAAAGSILASSPGGPPQGGVHRGWSGPAAGQGHHNCLSHLARTSPAPL